MFDSVAQDSPVWLSESSSTQNTWQYISAELVVPADKYFAVVRVGTDGSNTGGNIYFDRISCRRSQEGATDGATWSNNISGQPADELLINTYNAIGAYQNVSLPRSKAPCAIDCYVNNASADIGWFKVFSCIINSTNEAMSWDGLFLWGNSDARFIQQMRCHLSISTSDGINISTSQYRYSGTDLTPYLRQIHSYIEINLKTCVIFNS